MYNETYVKWYDRFAKGVATKEKHIDVLLEKGVITQEEYDSIVNQTSYVERTSEPAKVPGKVEQMQATIDQLNSQIVEQDAVIAELFMEVFANGVQ